MVSRQHWSTSSMISNVVSLYKIIIIIIFFFKCVLGLEFTQLISDSD